MVRRIEVVGIRFVHLYLCLCLCSELVAERIVRLRLVWLERLARRNPRGSSWEDHDGDVDECERMMVLIVTIRQVAVAMVVWLMWMHSH